MKNKASEVFSCQLNKRLDNIKSKSLAESIASLEEAIHIATQEGNTRQVKALKLVLARLKKKKLKG